MSDLKNIHVRLAGKRLDACSTPTRVALISSLKVHSTHSKKKKKLKNYCYDRKMYFHAWFCNPHEYKCYERRIVRTLRSQI